MSITRTVYNFLDNLDNCTISGWELFEKINAITGRKTYPTTLLRMAKAYAEITGGEFYCIDKSKSIYKFEKGVFKIEDAILEGVE